MPLNENLCIIIPVHKPDLTADEVLSLEACYKHLKKYTCFLVFPEGMNIDKYLFIHNKLELMAVNPSWLSSVERYNKMKLSLWFYEMFANYTYMLTYELDSYIFNPDFESINAFAFDFIGAPFFEGYWAATSGSVFMNGCNSGFSIRNIQSCTRALKSMKKYRLHYFLYLIFLSHFSTVRLKLNELTKNKFEVFITGRFRFYFADFHINEDVVWSEIVPQLFSFFKIADSLTALKFSFEYNLEKSLELNNGKLPLGCHAWYKHFDFWKTYIEFEGNKDL